MLSKKMLLVCMCSILSILFLAACVPPGGDAQAGQAVRYSGVTAQGARNAQLACTGPVPGNALVCLGDDTGLTASASRVLSSQCTDSVKCEYTCQQGYSKQWNSQNQQYECRVNRCILPEYTRLNPRYIANTSTMCLGDDTGLSTDTALEIVSSCTSGRKCELQCNQGYRAVDSSYYTQYPHFQYSSSSVSVRDWHQAGDWNGNIQNGYPRICVPEREVCTPSRCSGPAGTQCSGGVCQVVTCNDDGTTNLRTSDLVILQRSISNDLEYRDSCVSNSIVHEWRCTGRNVWESVDLPCPAGTTCSDGRCA